MVASPGEVIAATNPGPPETREHNNSTLEALTARFTRRRFLYAVAGASALVLAAGTGATVALRDNRTNTEHNSSDTASNPNIQAAPAFEKDLALKNMRMPETLELPTYAEVVAAVAQGVQYSVNFNDPALKHFIPGGSAHELQPGQFQLRATLIEGYRRSSAGTMVDDPNNPDDTRYYAWGYTMQLLEQLNQFGVQPGDVNSFDARVRITMGDLPPLVTQETLDFPPRERPQTFEATAVFSRIAGLTDNGAYIDLPNVNGQPGRGWGISTVSHMVQIAPELTQYLPNGYTEVPPLFQKTF